MDVAPVSREEETASLPDAEVTPTQEEAPLTAGPTPLATEVAPVPAGATPMSVMIPAMHPDHPPVMIVDPNMVPFPMAPTFSVPSVPMHLPDGTDLDLSKPPPMAASQAPPMYGAAPAPFGSPYPLPYPYPYPQIIYDPNNVPVSSVIYQYQDGTPLILLPPGMVPVQSLPPASHIGGGGGDPGAATPMPPMPAAGATPLSVVEGSPTPHPPELQRTYSQEATESLKSLLNINSDNTPSNFQQPPARPGRPPSYGE